jgi:hypothetical protein
MAQENNLKIIETLAQNGTHLIKSKKIGAYPSIQDAKVEHFLMKLLSLKKYGRRIQLSYCLLPEPPPFPKVYFTPTALCCTQRRVSVLLLNLFWFQMELYWAFYHSTTL